MEYTKGKWEARHSLAGDWVVSTDKELICRGVRYYNVDLIAAAPDLYIALKEASYWVSKRHQLVLEMIDNALAKAEGVENEK